MSRLRPRRGSVLGQRQIDAKAYEISSFAPLLDGLEIVGAVFIADALHTPRGHVEYLTARGAGWVFIVKGNQPALVPAETRDELRLRPDPVRIEFPRTRTRTRTSCA